MPLVLFYRITYLYFLMLSTYMSIAASAGRDTLSLLSKNPILCAGAIVYVAIGITGAIVAVMPLIIAPIIITAYVNLVDDAIKRRVSVDSFITGIRQYWAHVIAAYGILYLAGFSLLVSYELTILQFIPLYPPDGVIVLLQNAVATPDSILTIISLVFMYLTFALVYLTYEFLAVAIAINDKNIVPTIKKAVSTVILTPLNTIVYVAVRTTIISIGFAPILFQSYISTLIGTGLSQTVTLLTSSLAINISTIYRVCYYRRREEVLEHQNASNTSPPTPETSPAAVDS